VQRVLFVSNGHGEAAVAQRLALDVRALATGNVALDHLPLVGAGADSEALALVGPRRAMPSGGLVAMGNVRALARDFRAGLAGLVAAQAGFLRREGRRYQTVVAVGDVYALVLALFTGLPAIYVGTAKSVYVAPYGPGERVVLRRATRIFVRDVPTAAELLRRGVPAEAPGNTIVDLLDGERGPDAPSAGSAVPAGNWLALLPGSREPAYTDGVRLARLVNALGERRPADANALFSIASTLDPARFAGALAADGWQVEPQADAFEARRGAARLVGWRGPLGPLLRASRLAIGQAGTANEQAAAYGLPVVALAAEDAARADGWYRMRQRRLLGDALMLAPADPAAAAGEVAALLGDPARQAVMAAAGRQRMGPPGGSRAIAGAILELSGA
jgi:uncharacterized protein (TIGR03492 family)